MLSFYLAGVKVLLEVVSVYFAGEGISTYREEVDKLDHEAWKQSRQPYRVAVVRPATARLHHVAYRGCYRQYSYHYDADLWCTNVPFRQVDAPLNKKTQVKPADSVIEEGNCWKGNASEIPQVVQAIQGVSLTIVLLNVHWQVYFGMRNINGDDSWASEEDLWEEG